MYGFWFCAQRLARRAAVSAMAQQVQGNFRQEHELGNEFKYDILDTLPPLTAGRLLLQIMTLVSRPKCRLRRRGVESLAERVCGVARQDVPPHIMFHIIDGVTLQFATAAIGWGSGKRKPDSPPPQHPPQRSPQRSPQRPS